MICHYCGGLGCIGDLPCSACAPEFYKNHFKSRYSPVAAFSRRRFTSALVYCAIVVAVGLIALFAVSCSGSPVESAIAQAPAPQPTAKPTAVPIVANDSLLKRLDALTAAIEAMKPTPMLEQQRHFERNMTVSNLTSVWCLKNGEVSVACWEAAKACMKPLKSWEQGAGEKVEQCLKEAKGEVKP